MPTAPKTKPARRPTAKGPRKTGATLKDIALKAGVHHSIAGRVLSGDPRKKVQESTRARILKAARDLGYTRNILAAKMRTGLGDLALVMCARGPEALQNPAYQSIATAIQVALAPEGRCLVTHFYSPETRAFLARNIHESLYSGLVIVGSEMYAEVDELAKRIPALQIFHPSGSKYRAHLFLDEDTAARAVLEWAKKEFVSTLRPVAYVQSPLYVRRMEALARIARAEAGNGTPRVLSPMFLDERTTHQHTRAETLELFENLRPSRAREMARGTDALVDLGGEGIALRLFLERQGVTVPGDVKLLITACTPLQALWFPKQAFLMEDPGDLAARVLGHFNNPSPRDEIRVPVRVWNGAEILGTYGSMEAARHPVGTQLPIPP